MNYLECEPEFYKFLTFNEKIAKNTRTNYISWLRFLSQHHIIDSSLSNDKITNILSIEEKRKDERNYYTKDKDLSNFKSSLRKYLKFLSEDFYENQHQAVYEQELLIRNNLKYSETEKRNLVLSRIGQGSFRKELITYWTGCSVSNFTKTNLLIASHIKPWKESDNSERLDTHNGLLLLPNFDKLFDRGYVSFDKSGKIILSKFLSVSDKKILNLTPQLKLRILSKEQMGYLEYHREHCFIS